MPVVVSADEVDAKPIGFKQTYENGSWIDFGEGSLICGFGQFDDDYQVVDAFKDFYYEDLLAMRLLPVHLSFSFLVLLSLLESVW